jgi:hypothetical protein
MPRIPKQITLQVFNRYWQDVIDEDTAAPVWTPDFVAASIIQDRYARENPGTRYRLMSDVGAVALLSAIR